MQGVVGSSPFIHTRKSKSKDLDFFIHCESNGISSREACISSTTASPLLYLISRSTNDCIKLGFRNDDMHGNAVMIYNFCKIDDIQWLRH